ncbi:hypothetical protein AAY473_028414 [Plecturocebus cupreus]
MPVIPALWED